jgi:hypothetical protein
LLIGLLHIFPPKQIFFKMNLEDLYKKFYAVFIKANAGQSKQKLQFDANKIWNESKKEKNVVEIIENKILELESKHRSKHANLMKFWANASQTPKNTGLVEGWNYAEIFM